MLRGDALPLRDFAAHMLCLLTTRHVLQLAALIPQVERAGFLEVALRP